MSYQSPLPASLDPSRIVLNPGAHASPKEGMCAMEMVAWLAGEPHSDRPRCASQVIATYVRTLNDHAPDEIRQSLIPFLPRLIGTWAEDSEPARGRFLAWKAIRVFAPMAMRRHGLVKEARALERVPDFDRAVRIAYPVAERYRNLRHPRPSGADEKPTPLEWLAECTLQVAGAAHRFRNLPRPRRVERGEVYFCIVAGEPCVAAHQAAGVAFCAHLAGCDDIWPAALKALDEVIEVRAEARRDHDFISWPID